MSPTRLSLSSRLSWSSGRLLTMPGGWKMWQLQAEQPATTYAEFKKEILNEIARCLNMPFNVASGQFVGVQLRLWAV